MPSSALRFCQWTGCNKLVKGKYCEEHASIAANDRKCASREYNQTRQTITQQGYGADWRKVRNAYIAQHPLCEMCASRGVTVVGVFVHHIKEIKEGGARLNPDNLQTLCRQCHEKIHGKARWRRKT